MSIHLSCPGKRGLMLSVLRALDYLGLDIQEASIYNSIRFTLDISRAEVRTEMSFSFTLLTCLYLLFIHQGFLSNTMKLGVNGINYFWLVIPIHNFASFYYFI